MEENGLKVSFSKNLNKVNFFVTSNIPIDANANIKTVLNVCSNLVDTKIDCGNGKAIISGSVSLKVVYLDTDNILSTIQDNLPFNETITDSSLSCNCFIVLNNLNITNNILSTDGILKINCELSFCQQCI